jgi:hypothetical protein
MASACRIVSVALLMGGQLLLQRLDPLAQGIGSGTFGRSRSLSLVRPDSLLVPPLLGPPGSLSWRLSGRLIGRSIGGRPRGCTAVLSGTITSVRPSLPGCVRHRSRRARCRTASGDMPNCSPICA